MARLFDGTDQRLYTASTPITNVPLSLYCRFRKTTLAQSGMMMGLFYDAPSGVPGGQQQSYILRVVSSDATLRARENTRLTASDASVGTVAVGQWHAAGAVFASHSSRTVWLDGSSATDTTSHSPERTTNMMGIGGWRKSDNDGWIVHFDGDVCECAWWNIALSDADMQALAVGACPLFIKPESLVAYHPLGGMIAGPDHDVTTLYDMTAANGPAITEHPGNLWYPE